MALTIVWRNPIPPNCGDIPVKSIADDEFGTLYEVRRPAVRGTRVRRPRTYR
jgi:hypothetical protein